MVPKGGLEPPRVSPPPPQDGVSASSTMSAHSLIVPGSTLRRGQSSGDDGNGERALHQVDQDDPVPEIATEIRRVAGKHDYTKKGSDRSGLPLEFSGGP